MRLWREWEAKEYLRQYLWMNKLHGEVYPWEEEGIDWFEWAYKQHGVKLWKFDWLKEWKFQWESLKEYQVEMWLKAKHWRLGRGEEGSKWWEAQHAAFYDNLELKEWLHQHFIKEEDKVIETGKEILRHVMHENRRRIGLSGWNSQNLSVKERRENQNQLFQSLHLD